MSLQRTRIGRLEARRADPKAGRRFRVALLAGVAPHLCLTTLALLSYRVATTHEQREFAVMPVLIELLVIPMALALVLILAIPRRTRPWAKGLTAGTGPGLIVVMMLIAWHSNARGT
jgi:hypothetical protein